MALFVEDLARSPRPFSRPTDRDRDQEAEQDQGRPGDAQHRVSTSGGFHGPVALVDLLRQKSHSLDREPVDKGEPKQKSERQAVAQASKDER